MFFRFFCAYFAFGTFIAGIALSDAAFAQSSDQAVVATTEKQWSESFYQQATASPNHRFQFTDALFDGGDDMRFFRNDFNPNNSFPIQINREIYNNFDLLNTYTVVDGLKLYYEQSLGGFGWAAPNEERYTTLPFPFVEVNFGIRGSVEFRDIRQMGAEDVKALARATPSAPAQDDTEVNPYLKESKLSLLDPVKIPIKIPFSRRDVHKLRDGEMVSYTLSGQVGFGGSVGFKVLPSEIVSAGASALLETYLIGQFQVCIEREDDRFVKVRISKIKGNEKSLQLQVGLMFRHFLKGFFVFKTSLLSGIGDQVAQNVLPFQLAYQSEKDAEIAVAYRYDLNSDEGRNSFHRAVLGSFKESEIAAVAESSSTQPSVKKLFNRSSLLKDTGRSATFDLSLFFSAQKSQKTESVVTEIQSPDGTSHLQVGSRQNLIQNHSLTGNSEKTERKFNLVINPESFKEKLPHSVILSFENTIDDSKTNAKEINQYIAEVQSALHEDGLFPNFPAFAPDLKHPGRLKKANYGKSSFYYGYSAQEDGIEKFLALDTEKLAEAASALRVEFDRAAFTQAKSAYASRDASVLIQAFHRLFANRKNLRQFMELMFMNLDSGVYEKFVFGQNASFGSVQKRGHHLLGMESVLKNTSALLTATPDASSTVDNLNVRALNAHQLLVSFDLSATPEFLLFRVSPGFEDKGSKNAVEIISYNRNNHFQAGHNSFILDAGSNDPLERKLAAKLKADESAIITVGFKRSSANWGDGLTAPFKVQANYSP